MYFNIIVVNIYINISNAHLNQGMIMSNQEGKVLKLWCSENMVRVVALVNEGMAVSEAARVCSVPISTGMGGRVYSL